MQFLLYSAILLSTTLQFECAPKLAKRPDLITCGPNDEGTVVGDNESAWRLCLNGKLIQMGCMRKYRGEYKCISIAKIEAALTDNPEGLQQLGTGNICQHFFDVANELFPTYVLDLEPCEYARDQLAVPETPQKLESERAKRQSPVPPSETDTEGPGTDSTDTEQRTDSEEGSYSEKETSAGEVTNTEEKETNSKEGTSTVEETDTQVGNAELSTVDVSWYEQFKGGWRMKSKLRRCKEPAKLVDGIVSKCKIPYMCQTEKGACLRFSDVEHMFKNFHLAYEFGEDGAWDPDIFYQNLKVLETNDEYDMYIALEDMRNGEAELFETLVNLFEDDPAEKKVTLILKEREVSVNPANVCDIVENWAPFYEDYVSQRFRECPVKD